jgi:methionine-rich copper-binding protein CopC
MKTISRIALALAFAAATAGAASAHAKLTKADPAVNGSAAPTNMVHLSFSEEISGKLSGAEITDAKGTVVPASASADGKSLMLMTKTPLSAGAYNVAWHAVASDDGHRTDGKYKFSVK